MENKFKIKKGLLINGEGTVLDIQGTQGQLFSITDDLTGVLFSVNDISGLPILAIDSDDKIVMGPYNSNTFVIDGEVITLGGQFNLNNLITQGSENTALVISSTGLVGTRELGSNAFTSLTIYDEPAIYRSGGTPTLASGITAAALRALIGAGTSSTVGTVTSVTAGNGMTQSGTSTINPTLNIVSHAGTAGTIGTINIGADAIGVNLGTTSTTAAAGNHNHTLDSLSNTTITSNSNGELLRWDGTTWVNSTLVEANIEAKGNTLPISTSNVATMVATAIDFSLIPKGAFIQNVNVGGSTNAPVGYNGGVLLSSIQNDTQDYGAHLIMGRTTSSWFIRGVDNGVYSNWETLATREWASGLYLKNTTDTFTGNLTLDGHLRLSQTSPEIENTNNSATTYLVNRTSTGTRYYTIGTSTSGVTLRANNSIKLTTTDAGVTINGSIVATGGNSTDWNTAFGWGNHASIGYLTTEADTLQTVLSRNATTTTKPIFNGGIEVLSGTGGGKFRIKRNSTSTDSDDITDIHMDDSGLFFDIDNDLDGDFGEFTFRRKVGGIFENVIYANNANLFYKTNVVYHAGNLTLATLGYTGATNANFYTHPSYTARNIDTSGAQVIDIITSDASGHVTNITTRTLTLAEIGAAATIHTHTLGYYSSALATDLDTLYSTGQFGFTNTTVGRPESFGQGINIVSSGTSHNNSTNWITQLAFGTATNTAYFRGKTNAGAWGSWHTLYHSGNSNNLSTNWTANNLDVANDLNVGLNLTVDGSSVFYDDVEIQGSLTVNSVNTGQGFTSVYLMNQNVRTTDNVAFSRVTSSELMGSAGLVTIFPGGYGSTSFAINSNNQTATLNVTQFNLPLSAKVSIGNTNSTYNLDVTGTIRATSTIMGSKFIGSSGSEIILTTSVSDTTGLNIASTSSGSATFYGIAYTQFSATGAKVSIGNSNSTYNLDVTGTVRATGDVTSTNFVLSSDLRLKENIKELESKKLTINWKSFNFKSQGTDNPRYGVIAQELELTNPEFVITDLEGYKSVKYIDLLIAKVAELELEINKLKNNVSTKH